MLRPFRLPTLALLACLLPWSACRADYLATLNPLLGRFELHTENGGAVTIDSTTQRIQLVSARGEPLTYRFSEAVAALEADDRSASAKLAALSAALIDPANMSTFTGFDEPVLNLPTFEAGDAGEISLTPLSIDNARPGAAWLLRQHGLLEAFPPVECSPGQANCDCVFGLACSPYRPEGASGFFYSRDAHSPGGRRSRDQQRCRASHHRTWQRDHQPHCAAVQDDLAQSVAAGLAALGTCAASPTNSGHAGMECAASAAATVLMIHEIRQVQSACLLAYPGPPARCDN